MATNLSQGVADLARQIAVDMVAKEMEIQQANQQIAALTDRISALESKLNELISVAWTEAEVTPLSQPATTSEE